MQLFTPSTIREALELLKQYGGPRLKIIAGGTDLLVELKDKKIAPEYLLDITRIKELRYVKEDDNAKLIRIGPLNTHKELAESPILHKSARILCDAARQIGSAQIRSRGTIGGNIANASPAADVLPPLYVLSAKLKLTSHDGAREVDIEDFTIGPNQTVLTTAEFISEIRIPKMGSTDFAFFEKLGQRKALAIAKVSVACKLKLRRDDAHLIIEDVRIALGAVAPKVVRARHAEALLTGQRLFPELIKRAARKAKDADAKPIDDIRSSAGYRGDMVETLLYRNLHELLVQAKKLNNEEMAPCETF